MDEFSSALIQSASETRSVPSVPESVHLEPHPEDGLVDPIELLEYAVMVPEFVAEQDERRMVVVLEELHELERLGGDELLKRLRAWFQRHVYTTYLLVSSQADRMKPLISQRQQAFYRFAVMLEWPHR